LNKSLELAPQRAVTRSWAGVTLLHLGRGDDALAETLREPEPWARNYALAVIHHAAGRKAESDAALRELILTNENDAAYQIAEIQAMRGDLDAAFEWLDRAYVQKDAGVPWTRVDPFLRPLHGDPRWSAFLRKAGFAGQ
jgi:predicted Zn-dependent protease